MKSNKLRRLAAAVLAGTMMMAMSTSAFAEETPTAPTSVAVTKTVTKGKYDYAPATDFVFTIESGAAVTGSAGTSNIIAGPAGGLTFADGTTTATLESAPKAGDINETEITVGTVELKVDTDKFVDASGNKEYGIYRYTITETDSQYEGITYDTVVRTVDVYYTSEDVTFAVTNAGGTAGKGTLEFINAYGSQTPDPLHDVTITKDVTGNQGSTTKEFSFTFAVTGNEGEKYHVIIKRQDGTTSTEVLVANKEAKTITLKDGEFVKIYGLSASDKYTVTEADYSAEGYTTTIDGEKTLTKTSVLTEDTQVTVENNKNAAAPTGIITNVLPYAMMVVAAVALAFVFLRKREYDR